MISPGTPIRSRSDRGLVRSNSQRGIVSDAQLVFARLTFTAVADKYSTTWLDHSQMEELWAELSVSPSFLSEHVREDISALNKFIPMLEEELGDDMRVNFKRFLSIFGLWQRTHVVASPARGYGGIKVQRTPENRRHISTLQRTHSMPTVRLFPTNTSSPSSKHLPVLVPIAQGKESESNEASAPASPHPSYQELAQLTRKLEKKNELLELHLKEKAILEKQLQQAEETALNATDAKRKKEWELTSCHKEVATLKLQLQQTHQLLQERKDAEGTADMAVDEISRLKKELQEALVRIDSLIKERKKLQEQAQRMTGELQSVMEIQQRLQESSKISTKELSEAHAQINSLEVEVQTLREENKLESENAARVAQELLISKREYKSQKKRSERLNKKRMGIEEGTNDENEGNSEKQREKLRRLIAENEELNKENEELSDSTDALKSELEEQFKKLEKRANETTQLLAQVKELSLEIVQLKKSNAALKREHTNVVKESEKMVSQREKELLAQTSQLQDVQEKREEQQWLRLEAEQQLERERGEWSEERERWRRMNEEERTRFEKEIEEHRQGREEEVKLQAMVLKQIEENRELSKSKVADAENGIPTRTPTENSKNSTNISKYPTSTSAQQGYGIAFSYLVWTIVIILLIVASILELHLRHTQLFTYHPYYRELRVDSNSTYEEIRDAYRQRLFSLHPDKLPAGVPFDQKELDRVQLAWRILSAKLKHVSDIKDELDMCNVTYAESIAKQAKEVSIKVNEVQWREEQLQVKQEKLVVLENDVKDRESKLGVKEENLIEREKMLENRRKEVEDREASVSDREDDVANREAIVTETKCEVRVDTDDSGEAARCAERCEERVNNIGSELREKEVESETLRAEVQRLELLNENEGNRLRESRAEVAQLQLLLKQGEEKGVARREEEGESWLTSLYFMFSSWF